MNFFKQIKKEVETYLRKHPDFKNIGFKYDQDEITKQSFKNKGIPIIGLTTDQIIDNNIKNLCTTKIKRLFIISYNLTPSGVVDYDELDSMASKIQLFIKNGMENKEIFSNDVQLRFKDSPGSGKLMRVSSNRDIETGSYGSVINFELTYNLEDVL